MRALFLIGPGSTAARVLRAWLASGGGVAAVWARDTHRRRQWRSDRRLGRIRPAWSSNATASAHDLTVRKVPGFKKWPGATEAVQETGADVLISVYSSLIVPQSILDLFGQRAVNFHPALLPAFRGPTPTDAMMLEGAADSAGGMTLHVITKGIDEGPIIGQRRLPLSESGDLTRWHFDLARAAGEMARTELMEFLNGERPATPSLPVCSKVNI